MSSTFRILTQTVGEKGAKSGVEVRRIQQLLFMNDFHNVKPSGFWDLHTSRALVSFWEKHDMPSPFLCDAPFQSCDGPRAYVKPDDSVLWSLAYGAGVLIRLAPGGNTYRGSLALEDVHGWCEQHSHFTRNDHAVWGLEDYPLWAIVTTDKPAVFDVGFPSDLNCTLYANLMMSVWHQGNAHARPFDAYLKPAGDHSGYLAKRYYYGEPSPYSSLNDITKFTARHPDRLYLLEPKGFLGGILGLPDVGHEALLHRGTIYECNPGVHCHTMKLGDWLRGMHSEGWISGPSPQ